jgi:hypothetical protein
MLEFKLDDCPELPDLVVRSGRAVPAARRSLCVAIRIEYTYLEFIDHGADSDFATQLVERLCQTDNISALLSLCGELQDHCHGKHALSLSQIRVKITQYQQLSLLSSPAINQAGSSIEQIVEFLKEHGAKHAQNPAMVYQEDAEVQLRLDHQIDLLKQASGRRSYNELKDHLPYIDFENAARDFKRIRETHLEPQGSAFFVLQNSRSREGRLCLTRIRHVLTQKTRDFQYYDISITHDNLVRNSHSIELGLLDIMAQRVGMQDVPGEPQECLQSLIQTISARLEPGSIVLLEFMNWDHLYSQENMLRWLLEKFWIPLLQASKAHDYVKLIMAIHIDGSISSECLQSDLFCNLRQFDSTKIYRLPLGNWSYEDIQRWLGQYAGRTAIEVEHLAGIIYQSSQRGIPSLVHNSLMSYLV